jgi:carbon monoxide dehydrogenase subunit G
MKSWRYQVREQVEVSAPVERVYAVAADPESVPRYAAEVARIEVVERIGPHAVRVRSHLRIGGLRLVFNYRYRYSPPRGYSGVQEGGALLRGYFTFSFRGEGARTTVVSHTEGILSPVPGLARLAGLVYFRLLGRGGMKRELAMLKQLAESVAVACEDSHSAQRFDSR